MDTDQPAARKELAMTKTVKIVIGIVAALAAGGGADAAGYVPDPAMLKDLGVIGSIALIVYLHFVWLPIVRGGRAEIRSIAVAVGAVKVEEPEPVDTVVEEQPLPKKRASTHPQLVAVKPMKEPR